jgi:hypothetical protein
MAHAVTHLSEADTRLPEKLGSMAPGLLVLGLLLVGAGTGLALTGGEGAWTHFQFAYLTGYMTWLMVVLGALIFLCIQHLFRTSWSVGLRRVPEMLISTLFPWMPVLFLPILVPIVLGDTTVYKWLDPAVVDPTSPQYDAIVDGKSGYLNPTFLLIRLAVYFAIWTLVSRYLIKNSVAQDHDGDPARTRRMEIRAAPFVILFALSITFAGVDLEMSLDPHWFSTMWGVYMFAGAMMSGVATITLVTLLIQRFGGLKHVTAEHFQDLGKLLFGFTFFWGYIAFSQFMLIWYGNIPEETTYFGARMNGEWSGLSLALLFGHLLIPFPGLLSKHIKRNRATLAFWACWLLVFHFVDHYWIVMPALAKKLGHPAEIPFHAMDVLLWLGLGLCVVSLALLRSRSYALVPLRDPRLRDSLAFQNF